MKNKLFVLALILSMVFTLTACGGNSAGSSIEWELTEDGYESEYDFGAVTSEEGALQGTLSKLDYSDLNALQEDLQKAAEDGMAQAGLENFEFITDYEEMEDSIEEAKEEGYEVGDLVYCSGMEEDDMDLAAFESGCYNNPTDGKYYQYSIFSTKSYYGSKNVDVDEIIKTLNDTYGISLDKAKLEKAISAIETKAMEPIPEDESAEEAEAEAEEGEEEADAEDSEAEEMELDSDDMVFVDEDGNEIDLSELELEEDEESSDLEDDVDFSEDEELDSEEAESEESEDDDYSDEDVDDEEFDTLSEEEMDDLVFADEGEDFEGGYPCVMNQTINEEKDGYTDKIILSLISQQVSEEEALIYMSVEIDRCYNEQ